MDICIFSWHVVHGEMLVGMLGLVEAKAEDHYDAQLFLVFT